MLQEDGFDAYGDMRCTNGFIHPTHVWDSHTAKLDPAGAYIGPNYTLPSTDSERGNIRCVNMEKWYFGCDFGEDAWDISYNPIYFLDHFGTKHQVSFPPEG